MAGKIISIEIGYSLTKVCEVDYLVKNPKVYRSFLIPTPSAVLEDGVIRLEEEFVETLKQLLKTNKIKSKQVIFSIASSKIASREVFVPPVKENRIADVVRANAQEYFPIDISQYQFAHTILEREGNGKEIKRYKLLVLAAPNELLTSYYNLGKALGLELAALDYNGVSIYHAVRENCREGAQMVIKIEEDAALVTIIRNGTIEMIRTVGYGVDDAIQIVMNTKAFGDRNTYLEAVQTLMEKTCILPTMPSSDKQTLKDGEAEGAGTTAYQQARREITDSFTYLIGGISRVIDYYNSKGVGSPIDKILLTGLGGDFEGLPQLLSNELEFGVEALTKIEGHHIERYFKDGKFGGYIACIGAAIEPLDFISRLFDAKGKKGGKGKKGETESGKHFTNLAAGILVLGIVAAIVLVVMSVLPYLAANKKNQELQTRKLELDPVFQIYTDYLTAKADNDKMLILDEATHNYNEELVAFFTEMEDSMPSNLSVVSFKATAEGIELEVTIDTKEAAAKALNSFRSFKNVAFVDVAALAKQVSDTGEEKFAMSVKIGYKSKEEAAEEAETTEPTDAVGTAAATESAEE